MANRDISLSIFSERIFLGVFIFIVVFVSVLNVYEWDYTCANDSNYKCLFTNVNLQSGFINIYQRLT